MFVFFNFYKFFFIFLLIFLPFGIIWSDKIRIFKNENRRMFYNSWDIILSHRGSLQRTQMVNSLIAFGQGRKKNGVITTLSNQKRESMYFSANYLIGFFFFQKNILLFVKGVCTRKGKENQRILYLTFYCSLSDIIVIYIYYIYIHIYIFFKKKTTKPITKDYIFFSCFWKFQKCVTGWK